MKASDVIYTFIESKRADGVSDKTLKWYRAMLKPLGADFGHIELANLRTADMRELMIVLRNRTTSKATLSGYSVALRAFWRWCGIEYQIVSPMQGIKHPAQPKPQPRAIKPDDLIALYKACGGGWIGARNRAMLILMADTGIRAQGLLSLTIDDLDLNRRRAIVREKYGKTRPVPYTLFTMRLLKRWLDVRPHSGAALFCTANGEPLTYWGLRELLRRLAGKAGVRGRYNAHSFRHFAAREYLRQGGDLATLAELLGHADVSTTAATYAVFDSDEIAARHDQHSPLKTLFKSKT